MIKFRTFKFEYDGKNVPTTKSLFEQAGIMNEDIDTWEMYINRPKKSIELTIFFTI